MALAHREENNVWPCIYMLWQKEFFYLKKYYLTSIITIIIIGVKTKKKISFQLKSIAKKN